MTNIYAYVGGNPLSYTDPTGEDAVIPFPIPDIPAPPPAIAVGAAGIGGFMIGSWIYPHIEPVITRAVQACTDDDKEHCERQLKIDTDTCSGITRRRGGAAGAACHASASQRYAACLRGQPIPPLNTWNN